MDDAASPRPDPAPDDAQHTGDAQPSGEAQPTGDAQPSDGALKKRRRTAAWDRRRSERPRGETAAALDAATTEHGTALVASLVQPGATVCTYESWAVEPPTRGLNAALAAAGHRLLVPITLPDLDLDWRPLDSPDDPSSGLGHGVLDEVALVLAPATLVDRTGTRLGQGGGCYDRTLPRLRPGVPVVAVLFDGELTDAPLPRAPHDMPVDAVLTPSGVTWLRERD